MNSNNHFGVVVSNAINELKQMTAKTMLEQGKSEDEIEEFLESDKFGNIYMESCLILAKSFSESLEKYIHDYAEEERKECEFYLEHLRSIWGLGIAWMKQYRIKCMDILDGWGWIIDQSHIVSDKCNVFAALRAIHGKALLVYAEIICLLENGYPDGAYAHFRTLYELWAVAEFLHHDTDDVAIAFIKSANDKLENEADHYKWARTSTRFPDGKNVTIGAIVAEAHKTFTTDIKKDVSKTFLKKVYTFPNVIIHPSAKGIYNRTSYLSNTPINTMLIGSADTGLATPAINSSMYMYNITRLFMSMVPNVASAVGIHILNNIIGQRIIPLFEKAEKEQKDKHNEVTANET